MSKLKTGRNNDDGKLSGTEKKSRKRGKAAGKRERDSQDIPEKRESVESGGEKVSEPFNLLKKKQKRAPVAGNGTDSSHAAFSSRTPVHRRHIRLAEEVKTATMEEVNDVIKSSIFAEPEITELERDYIIPAEGVESGFLTGQPEDEFNGREIQPLRLSKEIADAFGIDRVVEPAITDEGDGGMAIFAPAGGQAEEEQAEEPVELVEEPEEEQPEFSEEAEKEQTGTGGIDVLSRLAVVSDEYFNSRVFVESGKCGLVYADESVDSVVIAENLNIQLPTYKVYVDGMLQEWDNVFEVKIPAGSLVEVETGVTMSVPGQVRVRLVAADCLMDKYSLECVNGGRVLSEDELKEPVVMSFQACDGAYLSKTGRVVECQLG